MTVKNLSAAALRMTQLSYEHNDQPLFTDLNCTLNAGELLQITGPNGCGKTTLLRIVCGLLSPHNGIIYWRDRPLIHNRQAYLSELAYLAHRPAIKANLTVAENLAANKSLSKHSSNMTITAALQQIGLAAHQHKLARTLSAGLQRRLALAKLLVVSATLWILDEPFTALDRSGIALIETLLTQHLQQGGMVILTSHQPFSLNVTRQQQINLTHFNANEF